MRYITQAELDALAATANEFLLPVVHNLQNVQVSGVSIWDAAIAGTGAGANAWYSKAVGQPTVGFGGQPTLPNSAEGYSLNPQPNYSFQQQVNAGVNVIPNSATYDATGKYTRFVIVSGDYNFSQGANDYAFQDASSLPYGGDIAGPAYSPVNNIFLTQGDTLTFYGIANKAVTATLALSGSTLLREMNRIRGDLIGLFLGYYNGAFPGSAAPMFLNPALICSGPWIVGVNEPQTWNLASVNLQGVLLAGTDSLLFPSYNLQGNSCIFNAVQFVSMSPTVTVASQMSLKNDNFGFDITSASDGSGGMLYTDTLTFGSTLNLTVGWVFNFTYTIQNLNTAATPPVASTLFTAAPNFGALTLSSSGVVTPPGSSTPVMQAVYQFTGTLNKNTAAAETDLVFTFDVPSGWGYWDSVHGHFNPLQVFNSPVSFYGQLPAGGSSVAQAVVAPSGSSGYAAPTTSMAGQSTYIKSNVSGKCYVMPQFVLSDTTVPGCWMALTLPVPAVNVFVDQDMPPYIGGLVEYVPSIGSPFNLAIAGNTQMDGSNKAPWASSMRQAAPIEIVGGGGDVVLVNKVQSTKPGITCRPTKWLVRRNTDFVPFQLGFNIGYFSELNTGQLATSAVPAYYPINVPAGSTKVVVRLMESGTLPGWNQPGETAGDFDYGVVISAGINIYASTSDYPDPANPATYDFSKTNGQINITGAAGSDGGSGYLAACIAAGAFTIAVAPPSGSAGFDIYIEVDDGTPQRVYTPQAAESFSYSVNGTPGLYIGMQSQEENAWDFQNKFKPIPQSGYCLFMVRATRLPVDNGLGIAITPATGTALTVTLGQNVQNDDGTITFTPFQVNSSNLTVSIPATAGTSGDVDIFIPVLAGNEVVYECDEQVILEVWVNWQPLFFNNIYQRFPFPFSFTNPLNKDFNTAPQATVFQYALSFLNWFDINAPGWPSLYSVLSVGPVGVSAVVFPLFGELIDDITSMLALLGASVHGARDAGGAGGSGSAGSAGSGSAGDSAGGGYGAI